LTMSFCKDCVKGEAGAGEALKLEA
jgi:hypothetical protein